MPRLLELGRRIWMLLHRRRFDRELAEEMRLHSDLRADQPRFGNDLRLREGSRAAWGWRWLDELEQDLRYAARTLRKTPVVTAAALLSLTLGIGANTALFSLANALLLRPLPVAHPEQLMRLVITPGRFPDQGFPNPVWEQLRDHQDVFSHAFALGDAFLALSQGGETKKVFANWASGDYFATLGEQPVLGRFFTASDDYRGCPGVVVLGYGFWHSHFAGAASAVGQIVQLSGQPFQIIGVAKPGFFGAEVGNVFDVAAPLCSEARVRGKNSILDNRGNWSLGIMGRLKPGIPPQAADARLGVLGPAIFAAAPPPGRSTRRSLGVAPGGHGFLNVPPTYPKAITALLSVAGLLLLVACANLTSLMLARGGARRQEMGVRLSIGASRGRLIRQVLTESLLLSFTGAAAGLAFAGWASATVIRFDPQHIALDLSLDWRVLAFTTGLAVATGLLFGSWPAWRATGIPLATAIAPNSGASEARRSGNGIVAAQVATALVLLTGAGLFLRSFANLVTIAPGFDPHHVVLAQLTSASLHPTDTALRREYALALARLRTLPGIASASESFLVPATGVAWHNAVKADIEPTPWMDVAVNAVSPGYFATLRTPLEQGREFSPADSENAPPVAIVNRALAHALFPHGSAVGLMLRRRGTAMALRIVGIAADARYDAIESPIPPTVYLPLAQLPTQPPFVSFELRSPLSSVAVEAAARHGFADFDPAAALHLDTLDGQIRDSLAQQRLLAAVAGLFGGLGLLLTAIGLYGVVSYDVERRRGEFGVRLALGAAPGAILRLVLRELLIVMAAGIGLGAPAAWIAARIVQAKISALLYGLTTRDIATVAYASAVLVAVALLAASRPARRAARLDPAATLREN